jgi:hypothetical protein
MADEAVETSNIVGLDGKAVTPVGQTPDELKKLLEDLLADVTADTYVAFAAVLVCPDGQAVTIRHIPKGQLNSTIGALRILEGRIIKSVLD